MPASEIARHNDAFAGALAWALSEGGVCDGVYSPGARNAPLLIAFARTPIDLHAAIDERAAAFYALGIAKITGRATVLVCTSGSAAAHYLPAVLEAEHSHVPLLILTADRPPERQGCGAPQTVTQTDLFGAHTRWSANLAPPGAEISAQTARTIVARALDFAQATPAGPVHLNVPFREPLWAPDSAPERPAWTRGQVIRGRARLTPPAIESIAALLAPCAPLSPPSGRGRRPVSRGLIVCGARAAGHAPEATAPFARAVTRLATTLGWPIVAEPTAQIRYGPHNRAPIISTADAFLRHPATARALAPDRILRFGQVPASRVVATWLARVGHDRTLLVDVNGDWHDPDHSAHTLVVADPIELCDALREIGSVEAPDDRGGAHAAWLKQWQQIDAQAWSVLEPLCAQDLWEGSIARAVVGGLGDGALLQIASSMPVRDLDSFTGVSAHNIHILSNRGVNGIDGTIAQAAGAAHAWRAGPVFLLLGDLAFLHDLDGLHLAAERGVSLTIIVVNNRGGGIFHFLPVAQAPQFEPLFVTPQSARLSEIGRALGARHTRVDSLEALQTAVASGAQAAGLRVIEAQVDRPQNTHHHRAAWAAVADALDGVSAR